MLEQSNINGKQFPAKIKRTQRRKVSNYQHVLHQTIHYYVQQMKRYIYSYHLLRTNFFRQQPHSFICEVANITAIVIIKFWHYQK